MAVRPLRILGLVGAAVLALGLGVVTTGQFTTPDVATAIAEPARVPEKPSYLVTVREPTPEEQAQREALFAVEPSLPEIDLTPRVELDVAAQPRFPMARVLTDVNVRSGPGTGAAVQTVATGGMEVAVIETEGNWTRVGLPNGAGEGWIASRFLAR